MSFWNFSSSPPPPARPLTKLDWSQVKARAARHKAIGMSDRLDAHARAARADPEGVRQQYDAARHAMLGGFSSQPQTAVQACMANDKAGRRHQRLDLIARAQASGCERDASRRLRADMDEVEHMRVAKFVYLAHDPDAPADLKQPPAGFRVATDQELLDMGLGREQLAPRGSNFRAIVCVKDPAVWGPDDRGAPYVLAFRGSTPHLEDWENNMMQGIDERPGFIGPDGQINRPYHQRAVEIGQALHRQSPRPSVHLVGHSLGGGLASAAQGGSGGATGLTASIYNAAGLHTKTPARYGAAEPFDPKIRALRIEGEAVTHSQEDSATRWLIPSARGLPDTLPPPLSRAQYLAGPGLRDQAAARRAGQRWDAEEAYRSHLHGMDQVIEAMESRKRQDEAALRRCLPAKPSWASNP
jgi:hypothetical protein